jgi:hypothetical protein
MKQLLAWTIRTTLRPALSPKTPLKLQRFCSDAASAIVLGPRGYKTKSKQLLKYRQFIFSPKRLNQDAAFCIYMAEAMWWVAQKSH